MEVFVCEFCGAEGIMHDGRVYVRTSGDSCCSKSIRRQVERMVNKRMGKND